MTHNHPKADQQKMRYRLQLLNKTPEEDTNPILCTAHPLLNEA